ERSQERELVAARLERRRDPLVRGQRRGRRAEEPRDARRLQIHGEPFGLLLVRHDEGERPFEVAGEGGCEQPRQRTHRARDDGTVLPAPHPREQVRVGGNLPREVSEQAHALSVIVQTRTLPVVLTSAATKDLPSPDENTTGADPSSFAEASEDESLRSG